MPKRLTVTYGDTTIFDGPVEKFTFTEDKGKIRVEAGDSSPSLGEQLVSAARQQKALR